MNLENAKEFYLDLLYMKMEQDEAHNVFTNYNNFSRDSFVFEETFKLCWELIENLDRELKGARYFRDIYANKDKVPQLVDKWKEDSNDRKEYYRKLAIAYEDKLKELGIDHREIRMKVATDD